MWYLSCCLLMFQRFPKSKARMWSPRRSAMYSVYIYETNEAVQGNSPGQTPSAYEHETYFGLTAVSYTHLTLPTKRIV